MKKFIKYGMWLVIAAGLISGCTSTIVPVDTSTGKNGLQQRAVTIRNMGNEFKASYRDVWFATISTLQLNGFILKQADIQSGFIYGVWQNTYEKAVDTSRGSFQLMQMEFPPGIGFGNFFSRKEHFEQVDVSVTFEPLDKYQTLVRISARFDSEGVPAAEGIFANRFFGLLRKEIFLRKNNGSIYQKFDMEKISIANDFKQNKNKNKGMKL